MGAVEPLTGERFFLVIPNCDTNNMSVFLKELSKSYNDDIVILVCDGAVWHKSKNLEISGNIIMTYLLTDELVKRITLREWICSVI